MTTPYAFYGAPSLGSQSPYRAPSPFLPPANLTSGSPYASPYGSPYRGTTALPGSSPNAGSQMPLPGTPNTPLHNFVPYANYYNYGQRGWEHRRDGPPGFDDFIPSWIGTPRNRRSSFNGGGGWPSPNMVYPPSPGYWPPPQTSVYPSNYPPPSGLHIHPLLNGDSGRTTLIFDLSAPKFSPMKYLGPGQTEWLSEEDLSEPATWPELNRLRIECDLIPQWPIVFEIDPSYFGGQLPPPGTRIPPISLGDILAKIYDHFAQRITHIDWANLTPQDEMAISKAYTARCKALGSAEAIERSHGVKRIDYALGKVWFRGLTRVGDGMEVMKLHLAKR